eukprot:gene6670-8295_t
MTQVEAKVHAAAGSSSVSVPDNKGNRGWNTVSHHYTCSSIDTHFIAIIEAIMRPQVSFLVGCSLVILLSTYGEAFYASKSRLTHATATSFSPLPLRQPNNGRPEHRERTLPPLYMVGGATQSAAVGKAAYKAISKLLATCGIGVLASKYKILDQTALSVLSKLIFSVFQPCLLFVNVASTVSNLGKNTSTGSPAAIYLLPLAALLQT